MCRGAADQFKITAVVFGGEEVAEERKLKEKEEKLRGRMVFPGQLSLLQAVGDQLDRITQQLFVCTNDLLRKCQSPLVDDLILF